jgi:ribonuclease R
LLLVEGKQCNRAIHDDKVFFSIINEENEKIYCKINHIIPSKRQIVGKVELLHGKKIHILNPINGRIAAMNIHPDSIPKKLKQKLSTHYFIAEYIGWNIKSEYPECKIIEEFGKFGDIDIETGSLLKTHGVEDTEYNSETVRAELKKFFDRIDPNSGEYLIPEEEISKREDLREKRIITIDPVNARDFDDALSVRPLGKDLFEVGVHIADASFFVEEGSEIDN